MVKGKGRNMGMDTISVIVPVYRVETRLHRCVDSILAQTYRNLEVILIDDGSPDRSGDICDEYAKKDSRVRVFHQENAGAAMSRNAGIEAATGEMISFVDSDDYLEPTMLETLYNLLIKEDADIAECGYRWVKPDRVLDRENTGAVDVYSNVEALEALYFGEQMFGGISIVVWNKLYRSELIKRLRFPNVRMSEDCMFTPMALYLARKVVKLNLNLYNFCFSDGSVSRSPYSLKTYDGVIVQRKLMDFFQDKEEKRYFQYSQSSYLGSMYYHYYECRLRKKDPVFREKANEIKKTLRMEYANIRSNPFLRSGRWRNTLFHISPSCWYWVMRAGKKAKYYLWLLRKKAQKSKK